MALGLKIFIKRKLGWLGTPQILPYTAYGDQHKVMITGAVVEDKGIQPPAPDQKVWKNVLNMIKRYAGDEISGVRVRIEYGGKSEVVRTNERGLFHTVLPNDAPVTDKEKWQPVRVTLLDRLIEEQDSVMAEGYVHINDPAADFIVVSDVDDTVMVSHSTRVLRKLRLMLSKNALTRSPFKGVSEFYRALHKPQHGKVRSIFYVSGSEWNLYDLLVDFFKSKKIPRGTLLLSDTKLRFFSIFRSGNKYHQKISRIQELFELYYRQPFVLIGDSGQKDPEIYLKIAEMYPSRVKAIYIRTIGKRNRHKRLEFLKQEAAALGTEMVPVRSTVEAARHALDHGFIDPGQIKDILEEQQKEEQMDHSQTGS
jgi:phosphatidate phosphatase APP1